MKVLEVIQGTDAWHAERAKYHTASAAPIMMGASSKIKRNELLHMKATGSEKEFSDWVQRNLFDKGHAFEASARTILEGIIGEDLYPVTATDDAGYLLASLDGLTMDEETGFEHKMWNRALVEAVRARTLDPEYYWQLEQELLVTGAKRIIFVVSDGTEDNFESMEYEPVPGRAKKLIDGWRQFDEDLKTFIPVVEAPKAVGTAIMDLPALSVVLTGKVTESNLAVFTERAEQFIAKINTDLKTDQDFADADATVKFLDKGERNLDAVKEMALAQTASIDELFKTLDYWKEQMRGKRLMLNKLVEQRKAAIKEEIRMGGVKALEDHVATINARLGGKVRMPQHDGNIAGVMKNKRTVASLRDAVDTEVARVKIATNEIAETMSAGLAILREHGTAYPHLFHDAQELVQKPGEDVLMIVQARVKAEAARVEAEQEALREKIRAEELARLEREEDARRQQEETDAAAAQAAQVTPERTAAPAAPANDNGGAPTVAPTPQRRPAIAGAVRYGVRVANLQALLDAVANDNDLADCVTVNENAIIARLVDTKGKFKLPGIEVQCFDATGALVKG